MVILSPTINKSTYHLAGFWVKNWFLLFCTLFPGLKWIRFISHFSRHWQWSHCSFTLVAVHCTFRNSSMGQTEGWVAANLPLQLTSNEAKWGECLAQGQKERLGWSGVQTNNPSVFRWLNSASRATVAQQLPSLKRAWFRFFFFF